MADGPVSGAEILARIKPTRPEDHVQLCLRPDLENDFQREEEKLEELRTKPDPNRKIGERGNTLKVQAEKVEAIRKEMEDASVWFRFRAVENHVWRALCDNHPPRDGNFGDMHVGYDRDAVLDELARISCYEPVWDEASWAAVVRTFSSGQVTALRDAANRVNSVVVELPFSPLASQILARPNTA